MPEAAGAGPVCAQAVDKTPNNTYLRESDSLMGTTGDAQRNPIAPTVLTEADFDCFV